LVCGGRHHGRRGQASEHPGFGSAALVRIFGGGPITFWRRGPALVELPQFLQVGCVVVRSGGCLSNGRSRSPWRGAGTRSFQPSFLAALKCLQSRFWGVAERGLPHVAPCLYMPPNSHIRAGRWCRRQRTEGWDPCGGRRATASAWAAHAAVGLPAIAPRPHMPNSHIGAGRWCGWRRAEGLDPRGRWRAALLSYIRELNR
jgi:hypothetical protein